MWSFIITIIASYVVKPDSFKSSLKLCHFKHDSLHGTTIAKCTYPASYNHVAALISYNLYQFRITKPSVFILRALSELELLATYKK